MKGDVYNDDKDINGLGDRISRNRNNFQKDMESNSFKRWLFIFYLNGGAKTL